MEVEKTEHRAEENNEINTYTVYKIFCLLLSVPPLLGIVSSPMTMFSSQSGSALMGVLIGVGWLIIILFVAFGLLSISKVKSRIKKLAADGDGEKAVDLSKRMKHNYLKLMVILWVVVVLMAINLPDMSHYARR